MKGFRNWRKISSKVEGLSREVGDLTYKGERLLLSRGQRRPLVVSGVTTLLGQLIMGTIPALSIRFSFASHPVLSACSVFSPTMWPSDPAALARYGYSEVQLLAEHFKGPLRSRNFNPDLCINEWPELKLRVQELLKLDPRLKYLALWQRILNESGDSPNLKNILGLVRIVLVIPVQTASLEKGFSLMKTMKMTGGLDFFR